MNARFLLLILASVLLFYPESLCGGSPKKRASAKVAIIDTSHAWASPCWGYNAPKIVRNARGEMWAVNWFGTHGKERARILKRTVDGKWHRGAEFDSLYQPGMIFLDAEGRLNTIQNSQTSPIRHYRSTDRDNLKNFSLVATGNGIPDGRGWYVGVAVHGSRMYLAYVTLQYDLFLTWKDVPAREWHPAVLVERGVVDTVIGNHSWLYPRFNFFGDRGYITVSSTVDGSKYNTYDKVCLVTFSLAHPEEFTTEEVFGGAVGYYSYSYDTIITPDSLIICGFNAGRHRYGPVRPDMPPAGLYLASRKIGEREWKTSRVDEGDGGLAFHDAGRGGLYALVTRGSWDKENVTLLKRSADRGKSWETVHSDVLAGVPGARHQFFAQVLRQGSGSALKRDTLFALLTNLDPPAPADGLFRFDLLHLSIGLPR